MKNVSVRKQKPFIETGKANGHTFRGVLVRFDLINVLSQVRKTFDQEEIRILAEDIGATGILQPSIIALLDEKHMEEYLSLNNSIVHSKTNIADLVSFKRKGGKWYLLVIGGERRYRAHKYLWEKGCEKCRKEHHGHLSWGQCFKTHFKDVYMEARLCENVKAEVAKEYQFKENNYIPPPSHELAYHYFEFLKTLSMIYKNQGKRLTLHEFAKKVGRSESTIRNALLFVDLPDYIREAVANGQTSYTVAIEFHRLKGVVSDSVLRNFFLAMSVKFKIKAETIREKISEHLENVSQPMLDFTDLSHLSPKKLRRQTVQSELTPLYMQIIHYLDKVAFLYAQGHLGKRKSIYSDASVKRMIMRFVSKAFKLLPLTSGKEVNFHEALFKLEKLNGHVKRLKVPT